MTISEHLLLSTWRALQPERSPYVFPEDAGILALSPGMSCTYSSLEEFTASADFSDAASTRFHLGLLPQPFMGNLQRASVFLLMLNPGFSPSDYFAEAYAPQFRAALLRTLRQDNASAAFPHPFLDPQFAWHPGFAYWQRKLHSLAQTLVAQKGGDYRDALQRLAHTVASVELVPYHSKSFGAGALIKHLPSTKLMLAFVHEVLLPRVYQQDALVIVVRSVRHWHLPRHENIITYEGAETQGAHLTLNSRGGQAIARHLGLEITPRLPAHRTTSYGLRAVLKEPKNGSRKAPDREEP